MDLIETQEKYKNILNIIKKGSLGKEGYDITKTPFFQTEQVNFTAETILLDSSISKKDLDYMNSINIPKELYLLYKIIGTKREFTPENSPFTFFSLDKIRERQEICKKNGQEILIDLGLRYIGMGHVSVITLNIKDGSIGLRNGGGANDFEREINFKEFLKMTTIPSIKLDSIFDINL